MIAASISRLRAGALAILLLMAPASAFAHEGHDHTDDKRAAGPTTLTPRLEARSGPFELVAFRRSGELLIYLDRFQTNEPITGAQVTVETPDGSKGAVLKDGVYRLAARPSSGNWASGSYVVYLTVATPGPDKTVVVPIDIP